MLCSILPVCNELLLWSALLVCGALRPSSFQRPSCIQPSSQLSLARRDTWINVAASSSKARYSSKQPLRSSSLFRGLITDHVECDAMRRTLACNIAAPRAVDREFNYNCASNLGLWGSRRGSNGRGAPVGFILAEFQLKRSHGDLFRD